MATAFSGEGARLHGGRWNPKGLPVVYTSQALSLAVLELLVHLEPEDIEDFASITAEVPDALIETLDFTRLPGTWQRRPDFLRSEGAAWLLSKRSLALRVPSVVIPVEDDVLLNPQHREFERVMVGTAVPFTFDPRLRRGP